MRSAARHCHPLQVLIRKLILTFFNFINNLDSGECNDSRRWREYLGKVLRREGQERKVRGQRLEEFGEVNRLILTIVPKCELSHGNNLTY